MHRAMQLVNDHINHKDKYLASQNKWKKSELIYAHIKKRENNKKIRWSVHDNFY